MARHPAVAGPRTGQYDRQNSSAFLSINSRRRLRRPPALTGWKSAPGGRPLRHRPNIQLSLTIGARPVALRAAAFSRSCGCRIVANAPARLRRRHPRTPPDAPLAGTPVGLDTGCNSSGPDCRAATGLRPQSGARPLELHPSVSSGGRRSRRREGVLSQRLMKQISAPNFLQNAISQGQKNGALRANQRSLQVLIWKDSVVCSGPTNRTIRLLFPAGNNTFKGENGLIPEAGIEPYCP